MTESTSLHSNEGHGSNSHHGKSTALHVHIVPLRILAAIWIVLMVFTVATVAVTYVDFGPTLNLWIAMAIATVKASLVALYFMHLRYDHPFNGLILIIALLFVLLFVGITMMDAEAYQPTVIPGYAPELTK